MSNFLPNSLVNKLGVDPTFDKESFIKIHEEGERVTSIRLNPKKLIHSPFSGSTAVPWCEYGYYLAERPSFTLDPLFHAGAYYPQDASSMFITHIVKVLNLDNQAIRALDLCGAPGGKSTLLNSVLSEDSLLVANEIIKTRVSILADNLTKWGYANTVVTNNDPAAFKRLPGYFDLVVVDAPCSGSGMFRKDNSAIDEWSEGNVKLCSERQQRILADSLCCLKTGGYLLYSTCSYSQEENEDIVDWLIDTGMYKSVEIDIDKEWHIDHTISARDAHGYRFYPHKLRGEGFFISVLQKIGDQDTFQRKKVKSEKIGFSKDLIRPWLDDVNVFHLFSHQEDIHIFPVQYESDLKYLQNVLYLKNAGTNIGKLNRGELIPHHALALSIHLSNEVQSLSLSLEEARTYLRKEVLEIGNKPLDIFGWAVTRFDGLALGWVKILANRINNYYPKTIRITNL